ncbi:hypothetical protein PM082_011088 [Marasmius tenuissimus]|nr:hypothetical protein PM082_011088 [Marasmius tenuissimus]
MATMYSQTHMRTAPQRRRLRLPKRSTPQIPGKVMTTLTTLVMIVITKGLEIPEFLKKVVP